MSNVLKLPKVEATRPRRGEIWRVDLEPTQGREIQSSKGGPNDTRPVLVLTRPSVGTPGVSLCAPISDYNEGRDVSRFWRVVLFNAPESGLSKVCCADVSQTRALDVSRFVRKDGRAHPAEVDATAKALATVIEVPDPAPTAKDGDTTKIP